MLNDALAALRLQDWYAFAAILTTIAIQLHRKVPALGAKLWALIPDGWRWLPPVAYGALVAFVAAFDEGKPLVDAIKAAAGGALAIGLGSMGFAAALKESAIRWDGGKGGKPKTQGELGVIEVEAGTEIKCSAVEDGALGWTIRGPAEIKCRSIANRGGVLLIGCLTLLLGCSNGSSAPVVDPAKAVAFAFDTCEAYPGLPDALKTEEGDEACATMKRARTISTEVCAELAPAPAREAADAGPADDDTREKPADQSDGGAP